MTKLLKDFLGAKFVSMNQFVLHILKARRNFSKIHYYKHSITFKIRTRTSLNITNPRRYKIQSFDSEGLVLLPLPILNKYCQCLRLKARVFPVCRFSSSPCRPAISEHIYGCRPPPGCVSWRPCRDLPRLRSPAARPRRSDEQSLRDHSVPSQ